VKKAETAQYFDGLGRPKQIVNVKASPTEKDVVTIIEYDGFGRQTKDYLPVPQSGTQNGAIYPNPLGNASSVYGAEKIYAEKVLENSPLDRIQKQIQPGNTWTNKPVKFDYQANIDGEVKKYTFGTSWGTDNATTHSVPTIDFYGDNQLYKNTVTDEDGNLSIEFKNGRGQTILARKLVVPGDNIQQGFTTQPTSVYADTYYVYNAYDQLAFVISPLASAKPSLSQTDLDELCYQYRYDGRNRMVEKKLPGKGWEYFVYDNQDRLVMTQDANRKENGEWIFTKYDQFGRVAYTGITQDSSSRNTLQALLKTKGSNNVERKTSGFAYTGLLVYYDNDTTKNYPNTFTKILSVNYYDTYPADKPNLSTLGFSQTFITDDAQNNNISTKSLPVAAYLNNLETNSWTKTYTYYDGKGRPLAVYEKNYLGGYTKTESVLDFTGLPQNTTTKHKRKNADTETVIFEEFIYDSQNRLVQHLHQVNGGAKESLAYNQYNELGQLIHKRTGGDQNGNNYMQSADYSYNIRNWLTGINLDGNGNVRTDKIFSYKINYNNPLEGLAKPNNEVATSITPRFNGNIAEISWSISGSGVKRYGYVYDKLNRLQAGLYQNPTNPTSNENSERLTYDLNGNILTLKRSSYVIGTAASLIDNLNYAYTGNQLTNIDDLSNDPNGYEGGNNTISYDANGNMIDMLDKNIINIDYNILNLPTELIIAPNSNTNVSIDYLYRADGTKLKKTNVTEIIGIKDTTTTTHTTEYLDGFQYLNSTRTGGLGTAEPGGGSLPGLIPDPEDLETDVALEREAFQPVEEAGKIAPGGGGDQQAIDTTELQFVTTAEGFYSFTENRYIYQYKDHLGNVRLSYANNNNVLEITDQNDYYPFGMNFLSPNSEAYFGQGSYKNYKMQSQELQETGFYAYKWRQYIPDVGRFFGIDKLSEKYPTWAPYVFSGNRVIDARELEGLEPYVLFNTRERAAANFGKQYNGASIINKREYVASIYSKVIDGKTYYAYNKPIQGGAHGIDEEAAKASRIIPAGTKESAFIHTHGNDDYGPGNNYDDQNFSGQKRDGKGDIGYAQKNNLDAYLVTPEGSLKYYDVGSDTEKTLRTDMPSDPNNETPRKNNINPTLNPNPSMGDTIKIPSSNTKPNTVRLDGGLKAIDDNRKREESMMNMKTVPNPFSSN
jgi:hypothetical protein